MNEASLYEPQLRRLTAAAVSQLSKVPIGLWCQPHRLNLCSTCLGGAGHWTASRISGILILRLRLAIHEAERQLILWTGRSGGMFQLRGLLTAWTFQRIIVLTSNLHYSLTHPHQSSTLEGRRRIASIFREVRCLCVENHRWSGEKQIHLISTGLASLLKYIVRTRFSMFLSSVQGVERIWLRTRRWKRSLEMPRESRPGEKKNDQDEKPYPCHMQADLGT